jgi:hypothetical protein
MTRQYENILSLEDIEYLSKLPEVLEAKEKLQNKDKVYFSIDIPLTIKEKLKTMGLDVMDLEGIPMRWIKGDTPSHIDRGTGEFENTYLVYLNDSVGELRIEDDRYSITKGTGYVFNEGLHHETVNTGTEPRLLLGPMNESGVAVGGPQIYGPGGTIAYIRQNGDDVEYSYDQDVWNVIYWSCYIENTNTSLGMLEIRFITDIKIKTASDYFIAYSENIQIGSKQLNPDGTRPKIRMEAASPFTYDGLIRNGDSGGNGQNNIEVYNLEITVTSGVTLSTGSGWLGQEYYGKGATGGLIVNCSSDGPINSGGGLFGNNTCTGGARLTIRACSSTGAITGFCGGLVGQTCSTGISDVLTFERCWTSGTIGGLGGGLAGNSCGINRGTIIATNCYSTGSIGGNAGGLFGASAGSAGIVEAENCYSTGAIGSGAGGIYGQGAGVLFNTIQGVARAINCFSTGFINGGGGIFGVLYGNTPATNCYTSGARSGGGGIHQGSTDDNLQGSGNYAESNNGGTGWNTVRAKMTLINVPTTTKYGVTWCDVGYSPNTPFRLTLSAYSPYSLDLVDVFASTVAASEQTDPGVILGYGYQILEINGDPASEYPTITTEDASGYQFYGQIKTTRDTPEGVYILRMYSIKNPYGVTTYTLTVTAAPPLPPPGPEPNVEVSCCDRVLELKGLDYETRNNILAGNIMIGETAIRQPMMSYSDYYKMKMAYASKR